MKAVSEALANAKEGVQQELADNLSGIQNNWHQSVRDLFDSVASEAGVKPEPADSLPDVAANTAAARKQKASGLYRQLDAAVGGTRFQAWDEQLANVQRALRNSAGIDPDADGRLVERINTRKMPRQTPSNRRGLLVSIQTSFTTQTPHTGKVRH